MTPAKIAEWLYDTDVFTYFCAIVFLLWFIPTVYLYIKGIIKRIKYKLHKGGVK